MTLSGAPEPCPHDPPCCPREGRLQAVEYEVGELRGDVRVWAETMADAGKRMLHGLESQKDTQAQTNKRIDGLLVAQEQTNERIDRFLVALSYTPWFVGAMVVLAATMGWLARCS